jgi:hypothetical protein
VLSVELLYLHSVKLGHVVVLEDVEHALQRLVKQLSLDTTLLELLNLSLA